MAKSGIDFKLVSSQFFDRKLTSRLSDAARVVLSKFGAFVRTTARQSIKPAPRITDSSQSPLVTKRRQATSKPGNPPFSHGANSPIRMIFFAYDRTDKSVIVGPIAFGSRPGEATDALEDGGTTTLIRKRRIGTKRQRVRVKARPFMRPAFDENIPHLRKWRNTVR